MSAKSLSAPADATPDAHSQAMMKRVVASRQRNRMAADRDVIADLYSAAYPAGLRWGLYMIVLVMTAFFAWAAWAQLEEVTSGVGKVIPTSREQVVQSLDSGVLAEILIAEGDTVDEGQALLRIDDVRQSASVAEGRARIDALQAAAARLRAESQGVALNFPEPLQQRAPKAIRNERDTYAARQRNLNTSLQAQQQAVALATQELKITEPMAVKGYVSEVEVLRIRRNLSEARGRLQELSDRFKAESAAELAKVESEMAAQQAVFTSREDAVRRTVLRAPKRGVVKNLRINTVGGVVQSGQDLLEIVPLDDRLLIETRIRPADIAFLRPGMSAVVKITAYDSAIYGWLPGRLLNISPDTLRDEVRRDETYYRALVETDKASLQTPQGKVLPIIPGMVAQVDIKTGQKSVLSYLFKPVLRAREALRER